MLACIKIQEHLQFFTSPINRNWWANQIIIWYWKIFVYRMSDHQDDCDNLPKGKGKGKAQMWVCKATMTRPRDDLVPGPNSLTDAITSVRVSQMIASDAVGHLSWSRDPSLLGLHHCAPSRSSRSSCNNDCNKQQTLWLWSRDDTVIHAVQWTAGSHSSQNNNVDEQIQSAQRVFTNLNHNTWTGY